MEFCISIVFPVLQTLNIRNVSFRVNTRCLKETYKFLVDFIVWDWKEKVGHTLA